MFKKVFILSGLIICIVFSACQKKEKARVKPVQKDTAFDVVQLSREGVIDYEIKTLKSVGVDPKNRKKVITEFHLKYPKLKTSHSQLNNSVQDFTETFVIGLLKGNVNNEDTSNLSSIDAASKAFIKSCKTNIVELMKTEPDWDQVWFCDIIGNVELQSDRYFTLRFKYNTFTGGAHGDFGEMYVTFDIKTGKQLLWSDVIEKTENFMALAERRFKLVNGIPVSTKLIEEEGFFFENNKFQLSDNFGLGSDGLIIYYSPYQVAPYSFGSTTLQFKYFEVFEFLKPSLFAEPSI